MKTLLFVDDEHELTEIVKDLLSSEGYICLTASSGSEAQSLIEQKTFDVILTDFNMPGMDGAELLFWCRKNNIKTPFVFVTGAPDRLPKQMLALEDCCSAMIEKPIDLTLLLDAIASALERSHEFDCRGTSEPLPQSKFTGQHFFQ